MALVEQVRSDPVAFLEATTDESVKQAFENSEESLGLSVASLLTFVMANFTGPTVTLSDAFIARLRVYVPSEFLQEIEFNGETVTHLAKYHELLWTAFTLLKRRDPCEWMGRCAMVLQKCLSGPSQVLRDICVANLRGVELAIAYRLFNEFHKFLECYDATKVEESFAFELVGILGKRTKFQQDSKAQLVVKVTDSSSKRGTETKLFTKREEANVREVKFDEDTATLERVRLDEETEMVPLSASEICLLMLETSAVKDRYASETSSEKKIALLNYILDYDIPHAIVTVAMYAKSCVEKDDPYAQQRAALQLEVIATEFEDQNSSGIERLDYFFQLEFPPLWAIRREMGLQLLMIGSAKTAARIFIEHQMWDELAMAGSISKDVDTVLDTLSGQPETPLTLCLLGELKGDPDMLARSWDISGCRFSRARRSLARWHLRQEDWKSAIPFFEEALALNSLYPDAWFSLGCSRMKIELFSEAVVAFQQVVAQKPDDAESFSNLAICLMTTEKWNEAHKAICQAVRFDRTNFKLWENRIVISLGAKLPSEVLIALDEMVRVCPKWCNCPLLLEIFKNVDENGSDIQRFVNALDTIAESVDDNVPFYSLYGDVLQSAGVYEREFEMRVNVLTGLERDDKPKGAEDFQMLVECAEQLVKAAERVPGKTKAASQRVRVLMRKYETFSKTDDYAKLEQLIASLSSK